MSDEVPDENKLAPFLWPTVYVQATGNGGLHEKAVNHTQQAIPNDTARLHITVRKTSISCHRWTTQCWPMYAEILSTAS